MSETQKHTEAQHTPLPWIQVGSIIGGGRGTERGRYIAEGVHQLPRGSTRRIEVSDPDFNQVCVDLEYAVRCVNSHADLLAACEGQRRIIEAQLNLLAAYRTGRHPTERHLDALADLDSVITAADSAISRARGVTQ